MLQSVVAQGTKASPAHEWERAVPAGRRLVEPTETSGLSARVGLLFANDHRAGELVVPTLLPFVEADPDES
jgi:hypothetical protein